MAMTLEEVLWMCLTFVKAVLRFAFMVSNNLVAIPSYIFYIIILQPLRVLDRKLFWYIEGIMYKWLLAMVASWGWCAGYTESKPKGLQWVIDTTIAYPKAEPIDIQTWILGYRRPTVTHVHYRIFPIKDVPLENDALTNWLYERFIEKEDLLSHFYETGAFPPEMGQKKAISKEMTLNNMWLFFIQSFAFLSGYMWYNILRYFYHCLF